MNKLLTLPLFFLLILSMYSIAQTATTLTGESPELPDDVTIEIPEADVQEFNMWQGSYSVAIILAAIAVGVLAGITVFSTGLSDQAQTLLFNSILFMSLWGCLSAVSSEYMFQNSYTTMLWILLTTIYVVGLGLHMSNAE